jgi:hypothetical protein
MDELKKKGNVPKNNKSMYSAFEISKRREITMAIVDAMVEEGIKRKQLKDIGINEKTIMDIQYNRDMRVNTLVRILAALGYKITIEKEGPSFKESEDNEVYQDFKLKRRIFRNSMEVGEGSKYTRKIFDLKHSNRNNFEDKGKVSRKEMKEQALKEQEQHGTDNT